MSTRVYAILFSVVLVVLAIASLGQGSSDALGWAEAGRGALAWAGLGDSIGMYQTIAELRLMRVLLTIAVGAGLSLSGALLQGVFRNDLASPSVIGVSSGASLGAALVMLIIGGYGPRFLPDDAGALAPWLVGGGAFIGAVLTVIGVTMLATTRGRISVPTLLLVGVAINAIAGGGLVAIQSFALQDYQITQALYGWLFGRLEDRVPSMVGVAWGGVAIAAAAIPFCAWDLDLMAAGEDDARALGVPVRRTKRIVVAAAALSAAMCVSVAGQIGFVGLIAPHVVRRIVGRGHRALLPMCLLGGPILLLGADFLQRVLLAHILPPGVVMALLGGPFFLFLLLANRKKLEAW